MDQHSEGTIRRERRVTAFLSLLLRLLSLVGKLALTLYMARTFSLEELGRYGLAFGGVILAAVLFGFRLEYVISREILGFDLQKSRRICTAIGLLFLGSFAIAAPVSIFALQWLDGGRGAMTFPILVYLLCCVESYATFLYAATISLKRPALANGLFFIRAGLWPIPAILLSLIWVELRTADFVLLCWILGSAASVVLNVWLLRTHLVTRFSPRDLPWAEIRVFIGRVWWMWIGSVAVTLGAYADRFVLASFLTLNEVGVATFYISFTTAVVYLVQSGTTQVSYPLLIEYYEARRRVDFRREFIRTGTSAALMGGAFLACLGVGMPFLAAAIGKPELQAAYPVFVVLLVATWIRINAETLYFALFVERRDTSIWVGNLYYLACSLVANIVFIRWMGLMGLAIATLISATFIAVWRGFHAFSFDGNMLGKGKGLVR